MITASRTTAKAPDLKYWLNAMIETAAFESMLNGLKLVQKMDFLLGPFLDLKIDGVPV